MRIGIDTSIAGSLERAALEAHSLGANCFQIFSASPRMWRAVPPDPAQIRLLRAARERHNLSPLAIHAGYLINLASLDPVIRGKSIEAFRGELERADAIGAECLVIHPGACRGRPVEEGVAAVALALQEAVRRCRAAGVTVLLENTVGAGGQIGARLEDLAAIRSLALELTDLAVGYCLDTCHLLGAGFDIRSAAGLRATVRQIEQTLGMANVRLIHANDSKGALGSRIDRHANIGEGRIGLDGFRRILRHPKLASKPFILETPVAAEGDDRRNVAALQSLAR